jgi:riboflavin biosynthesis pyrimidine reductase
VIERLDASPGALSDDELLALYDADGSRALARGAALGDATRSWLRVNFVATVDGSASADGVSGSLGGPSDLRVFDLLRRLADVVLVAAGTVRDEGYGPMRVSDDDVTWRRAHGMADHPVFAIVTGSLGLDPASSVFTEAPVRPIVLTAASAPADRRAALASVADVVDCGTDGVDAVAVRRALVDRGLRRIHCEGGPSFLGSLIDADLVDELCLSVSPNLEGGAGPRIARAHGAAASAAALRRMRIGHVLRADDDLLLTRYVRAR